MTTTNVPAEAKTVLVVWTVYHRHADFPHVPYVARRFELTREGTRATSEIIRGETLGEVRRKLPAGLVMLSPMEGDARNVVEAWL